MIIFTLEELLDNKNISKYRLSKDTGIDINNITKICNNQSTQVKFDTLDIMCDYLECNLTDIIFRISSRDFIKYCYNEIMEYNNKITLFPRDNYTYKDFNLDFNISISEKSFNNLKERFITQVNNRKVNYFDNFILINDSPHKR